jgi:catechol 2,3-dioxygenase-like lactoylglutathione lyase family enzyme
MVSKRSGLPSVGQDSSCTHNEPRAGDTNVVTGINHVTLAVRALEATFHFYVDTLGLVPIASWEKAAYLTAGSTWVALVQDQRKEPVAREGYGHLAFNVSADEFESLAQRIRASGAEVWQENSSEGASLYFLDPSGNKLEIHATSLQARMAWLDRNPPQGFVRYAHP